MNYLFLLLISLSSFATDFPSGPLGEILKIDGDSGIRGVPYAQIVNELNLLEASYRPFAKVVTYGKSVEGRPLTLIRIAKKSVPPRKAVYIGGSIHGNEYLNIEDRLPRWFLEQTATSGAISTYLNQGGVIYIAPILNPDGYDRRDRENRNGVDLNRDYTVRIGNVDGFKQVETRSLFEYLNGDLGPAKLRVAMDYHCCLGALLYPWSFRGPVLNGADKKSHIAIGAIMKNHVGTSLRVGTTPELLGYSAAGTSKDFYYEHFGALGFTFEGRKKVENEYFQEHTAMWEGIIKEL